MAAHDQAASRAFPGPDFHAVLRWIHEALNPAVYVEIGVLSGCSLALVQPLTLAIGIDPCPHEDGRWPAASRIFALTSNEFFSRHDLHHIVGDRGVDLALIDGLHLFEQVFEDLCHLERYMAPGGLIAVHDTIPLNRETSSRLRTTEFYTGDVWKILPWLRQYRPELDVVTVTTAPGGLTLIRGLNPQFEHPRLRDRTAGFVALGFEYFEQHREEFLRTISNQRASVEAFCQNTPVQSMDSNGAVIPSR